MIKGLQNRAGHDPRAAALVALSQVLHGGQDSQTVLDRQLGSSKLVPSDKALCTELFYGTLRHHLRLEWYLGRKLSRPEKLPQELALTLELALYELKHTRIPAHAAVNWAVEMASNRFGKALAGVVNGVLRGIIRSGNEYFDPGYYAAELKLAEDSPGVLGLLYATPEWIVRLWGEAYGMDACINYLEAGLKSSPQALRINEANPEEDKRIVLDELQAQNASKLADFCWLLKPGSRFPVRAWQEKGLVSRQSAAAYEVLFAMRPAEWPDPVWDACAGRGNKSLALLEAGVQVHTASDPSKKRLDGLPGEMRRLGLDSSGMLEPRVVLTSAAKAGFEGEFGTVLVDAPCSGLGTLGHRPEIRWRRAVADVDKLILTQAEILDAAARALHKKTGNRIIYMTCTLNRAENQEQVERFLSAHPGFELRSEFQTPADSPLLEFFYAAELVAV